jgi:hypothetical protein
LVLATALCWTTGPYEIRHLFEHFAGPKLEVKIPPQKPRAQKILVEMNESYVSQPLLLVPKSSTKYTTFTDTRFFF